MLDICKKKINKNLFLSCRIIAAFEDIVNVILQYISINEPLLVVEGDVALRAERVRPTINFCHEPQSAMFNKDSNHDAGSSSSPRTEWKSVWS